MSGYEFTHPILPERDECESCGHAIWREAVRPPFGCQTKAEHDAEEKQMKLWRMMYPMARSLNEALYKTPIFDAVAKEDASTFAGLLGLLK